MMEKRGFETAGFSLGWLDNAPPSEEVAEALDAAFEANVAYNRWSDLEDLRGSLEKFSPNEELPGIDTEVALNGLREAIYEQQYVFAEEVGVAGEVFRRPENINPIACAEEMMAELVRREASDNSEAVLFDKEDPLVLGHDEFEEAIEEFAVSKYSKRGGTGRRVSHAIHKQGIKAIKPGVGVHIGMLREWVESEDSLDVRNFGEGSRKLLAEFLDSLAIDDQDE